MVREPDGNTLLSSSHKYWGHLRDLFGFIDQGEEQLGVYEYNGGLFDSERHPFFQDNSIGDKYIAEAVRKVSYSEAEGGFIDYQDLDVRELGAIYEGLLEHKPVVEEKQVKWEEDLSERKKTGSYYTPEYIVKYIVENTIDPLVEEKKEDIQEEINELEEKRKGSRGYDRETYERKLEEKRKEVREEILDLKVLDPAMGSGHFLVEATEKLANSIASLEEEFSPEEEEETTGQITEREDTVKELKRQIVERSIYGVDKNPLATELAKLSLWLHTVAKGEPLSFLDHHLRTGDSLIGIDIEEMKTMPSEREQMAGLFTSNLVQDLGNAIGHLNLIEKITSGSRDDVQEKKTEWRDVRSWIDKYKKAANVRLSTSFGNEVSDDEYRAVLQAAANNDIESVQDEEFFQQAQEVAENKSFFHWELEFPDIFRNKRGKRKSDPGFDVVAGNPPYVEFKRLSKDIKNSVTPLFDSCKGKFDLYIPFIERSIEISKRKTALIAPSMFMKRDYGKELRKYINTHAALDTIIEFEDIQIFQDVTNFTSIFITDKLDSHRINYLNLKKRDLEPKQILEIGADSYKKVRQKLIGDDSWKFITPKQINVLEKMKKGTKKLGKLARKIAVGVQTGKDSVFLKKKEVINEKNFEKDVWKPLLRGRDIHRWTTLSPNTYVFYPYTENGELITEDELETEYPKTYSYLLSKREKLEGRTYFENSNKKWYELWCPRDPSIFIETPKLLVQEISNHNNFSIDKHKRYFNTKVFGIIGSNVNLYYLLAILNSSLLEFQFKTLSVPKRGGYYEYKTQFLKDLSINFDQERSKRLIQYSKKLVELSTKLKRKNRNLLDYIGDYREGRTLGKIYTPPEGLSDTILQETTKSRKKLKISEIETEENQGQLVLKVAARYKPEDKHENRNLDRWGYTGTESKPAMNFSCQEEMEYLIREFVPIAVDKAGGFANFRENATKKSHSSRGWSG